MRRNYLINTADSREEINLYEEESLCKRQNITSDREKPYAESFIAEDGYITWIGNREDMPGGEYEYVDLGEKRVIPGLIDCHMHPSF